MVKGIYVEFKKKKKEEDGTMTRKKRKRDKMEEPPIAPFLSRSSCVSSSTWHSARHQD
jgi:hypothetical protein